MHGLNAVALALAGARTRSARIAPRERRPAARFPSFGDGAHHCPGWQVALHEGRAFIDALFRVPGIRLTRAPDIGWSDMLQSHEPRGAMVACGPA